MPKTVPIEIRRARKEDVPFVLRMWSFILGDLVKGHPYFRPSWRATNGIGPHMRSLLDDDATLILVAARGTRRVGFLNASVGHRPFGPKADLIGLVENIYVDPGLRGHGVSKSLFNHALRWLEGKKVGMVEAVCEADNDRAIGFFGKFGFDLLTLTLVRPLRKAQDRRATDPQAGFARRPGSPRRARRGTARAAR